MQRTPTVPWLNAASMLTITSSLTKKKKKKKEFVHWQVVRLQHVASCVLHD